MSILSSRTITLPFTKKKPIFPGFIKETPDSEDLDFKVQEGRGGKVNFTTPTELETLPFQKLSSLPHSSLLPASQKQIHSNSKSNNSVGWLYNCQSPLHVRWICIKSWPNLCKVLPLKPLSLHLWPQKNKPVQRWRTYFQALSAYAQIIFKFSEQHEPIWLSYDSPSQVFFLRRRNHSRTVDFGFTAPSILVASVLFESFVHVDFFHTIPYLIRFDPPPSILLQANCWSSPLTSLANRRRHWTLKHSQGASTGVGHASIGRLDPSAGPSRNSLWFAGPTGLPRHSPVQGVQDQSGSWRNRVKWAFRGLQGRKSPCLLEKQVGTEHAAAHDSLLQLPPTCDPVSEDSRGIAPADCTAATTTAAKTVATSSALLHLGICSRVTSMGSFWGSLNDGMRGNCCLKQG